MCHLVGLFKDFAVDYLLTLRMSWVSKGLLVLPEVTYVTMGGEGFAYVGSRAPKRAPPIVFHQLQPVMHASLPRTSI